MDRGSEPNIESVSLNPKIPERALNFFIINGKLLNFCITMIIQGVIGSIVCERLFSCESILIDSLKFAMLACPLALSFMVLAISAKHQMYSVSGFFRIETTFVLVHYSIVSPLIAAVYARKS